MVLKKNPIGIAEQITIAQKAWFSDWALSKNAMDAELSRLMFIHRICPSSNGSLIYDTAPNTK